MTLQEKIDSIDYSKVAKPDPIKAFIVKVQEKAKTSMTEAQALMDGILLKIQEKYPDAIVKKIAPEKAKVVIEKIKKMKNIVPRKADFNKIADQILKQQPYFSRQQAEDLAKLRIEAQVSRANSFNEMIDVLSKSDFYAGRLSTANIDKGRTRSLQKDASLSSFTEADERKMTGRKFKRISKGGHKNQYGTTKGGNVYYEYRDNRRDVDKKIRLAKGGIVGNEVEFMYFGEPRKGTIIEDFGDSYGVQSGSSQIAVDKQDVTNIFEAKKGRFFGVFKKGGKAKEPTIVRGYFDDEPYEFGDGGGISEFKNKKQGKLSGKIINVNNKMYFVGMSIGTIGGAKNAVYEIFTAGSTHSYRMSENKMIEFGNKFAEDGQTKEPTIVRGYFDDEPYEYAKGGRFQTSFKKGGNVNATYIPNKDIKALTTKYGSTIRGKDLLDGAYTTRKNVRLEPKVDRFMFEDEMYEYAKGGRVDSDDFNSIKKGDVITISYKSAISKGSVDLLVKSKTRVGKGKSWESEKITFINTANPKGVNFYAYMRNDSSVGFAIGDMAIWDVKILSHR
jgi:hypothetical protein